MMAGLLLRFTHLVGLDFPVLDLKTDMPSLLVDCCLPTPPEKREQCYLLHKNKSHFRRREV